MHDNRLIFLNLLMGDFREIIGKKIKESTNEEERKKLMAKLCSFELTSLVMSTFGENGVDVAINIMHNKKVKKKMEEITKEVLKEKSFDSIQHLFTDMRKTLLEEFPDEAVTIN